MTQDLTDLAAFVTVARAGGFREGALSPVGVSPYSGRGDELGVFGRTMSQGAPR